MLSGDDDNDNKVEEEDGYAAALLLSVVGCSDADEYDFGRTNAVVTVPTAIDANRRSDIRSLTMM